MTRSYCITLKKKKKKFKHIYLNSKNLNNLICMENKQKQNSILIIIEFSSKLWLYIYIYICMYVCMYVCMLHK